MSANAEMPVVGLIPYRSLQQRVSAGMMGFIVGMLVTLVAGSAIAMPLFRRMMRELPAVREQWREIHERNGDSIACWNRCGCLGQIAHFVLLAVLLF
jgi:hypothetical protein